MIPRRPHAEDEVYYVISGRATVRVDGRDSAVSPGSVVFVGSARRPPFPLDQRAARAAGGVCAGRVRLKPLVTRRDHSIPLRGDFRRPGTPGCSWHEPRPIATRTDATHHHPVHVRDAGHVRTRDRRRLVVPAEAQPAERGRRRRAGRGRLPAGELERCHRRRGQRVRRQRERRHASPTRPRRSSSPTTRSPSRPLGRRPAFSPRSSVTARSPSRRPPRRPLSKAAAARCPGAS